MPSMLSANDRRIIKTVIPSSTEILAASLARVYLAYPDPHSWSDSGLQGALLLVADSSRGAHFFCLIDLVGSRGKIWEHEIHRGFECNQDRVLISFPGDECMIGLLFPTDNDAKNFHKRVVGRKELKAKAAPKKQNTIITHTTSYDPGNGFTSCGVDSSWVAFLDDLQAHGVDEAVIAENMDFIKCFVRGTQDCEAMGAAKRVSKKVKPPQPSPKADSGAPKKQSIIRMNYDGEKGFTSSGVDPSWVAFLDDLKAHGVDEAVIAENMDYIKCFVRGTQDCEAMGAAKRVSKKVEPPQPSPKADSGAPKKQSIIRMNHNAEKGFTSSGVDPSWVAFLDDLKAHGVDEAVITENMDFIEGFVRGFQECEAVGAVNRGSKKEKLLQPPPAHAQRDSTLSTATPPPILHPLLPSRGIPPPRAPRPPANAPSLVTPQFPLRATPPPPRSSVAPPPPAPPSRPISIAASAPPPPVGLPVIPAPPPPPGGGRRVTGIMSTSMPPAHGDLLTSIQGKGVHSLRKTDGSLPAPSPAALASSSDSSGSGFSRWGDLTAALMQRNKKLGDSDMVQYRTG